MNSTSKSTEARPVGRPFRGIRFFAIAVALLSGAAALQSVFAGPPKPGGLQAQKRSTRDQRTPSSRASSLSGQILVDGGQPLAEASIIATPTNGTVAMNLAGLSRQRNATSDETGKFNIEGLGPGAYIVRAIVPGFVGGSGTGAPTYYRPGDSVTINLIKGGVVTGSVMGPGGEPIVGIRVRATMLRDANGRPGRFEISNPLLLMQDWATDDRGVYRIFGLEPGSYVVSAGGRSVVGFASGAYENDAPTYYPSATRDTAVEVTVHSGQETSGIDIRYREWRGHSVSGAVQGRARTPAGVITVLSYPDGGGIFSVSSDLLQSVNGSFQFDAVPDGTYYVAAMAVSSGGEILASPAQPVEVRGSDVTGLELTVAPLASVAGRLVLESSHMTDSKLCPQRSTSVDGSVILARGERNSKAMSAVSTLTSMVGWMSSFDAAPDEKGDFKVRALDPGRYHLQVDLPADDLFIRTITQTSTVRGAQTVDLAREGIPLKPGEQVSGVIVNLGGGAAAIKGKVAAAKEGASLPRDLRVHLVPAEKEASDDVLRYFEVVVESDGSFSIKHIPPGRYFLLAKQSPDSEQQALNVTPVAWDAAARANLRREAEAKNAAIELLRCHRVKDQVVQYAPQATNGSSQKE